MKSDAPSPQKVIDVAITTGTTVTADVATAGYSEMLVIWRLIATTTAGDLNVNAVRPYTYDGPEDSVGALVAQDLLHESTVAPASDGADVVAQKTYRLRGQKRVQVSMRNNNAGTKTGRAWVFLIP